MNVKQGDIPTADLKLIATRVSPEDHERFRLIAKRHNRNITGHLKTLIESELAAHEEKAVA